MVETATPVCDFGWAAPNFELKGVDGRSYTLADVRGLKGTLVMFICNHCPYVKAVMNRIVRDAQELQMIGVGVIAIMPNDQDSYVEDNFENMIKVARDKEFTFPYVIDDTQEVARAYDAVCTPDFYGFNEDLKLQYRGRIDASHIATLPYARRELFEAMVQVVETKLGPEEQVPSIGCSIKWKGR